MTERRPRLSDVAEQAGVSLKTASRVLNDEPGVSPGKAERVRLAIADLGYVPDPVARRLRMGGATAPAAAPGEAEVDELANLIAEERGLAGSRDLALKILRAGYQREGVRDA